MGGRIKIAALGLCLSMGAALAHDDADADHGAYFLMDPEQCTLDPVMLEEADAIILTDHGFGNHQVACIWPQVQDFDGRVGEAWIVNVSCEDATQTWTQEHNVIVPIAGIVAIKPLEIRRLPSQFHLCK